MFSALWGSQRRIHLAKRLITGYLLKTIALACKWRLTEFDNKNQGTALHPLGGRVSASRTLSVGDDAGKRIPSLPQTEYEL